MFGGLHINVRSEAFEKSVDVIVLKGKMKFACELLETGVNILKKSFGPDHFNVASLLYKQGTILSLIGEVTSSAEKFKCSVDILQEIFGVKHPLLLKCYLSLGDLALRSKRTDESYLYFQRAMENIEAIYQVSFVSQLSSKYTKLTANSNSFQGSRMRVDRIEGLVAEYGLPLAVLLSQMLVQNNKRTSRSYKTKENSHLRQRVGGFNAHPPCVLIKKRFGKQESLDENHDLNNCLEELNEVTTTTSIDAENSKRATEDAAITSFDCQLNLKLMLIFLILLSIELNMIDTTFAAYNLYVKLSQNDNDVLFLLNDGIQVYASRTSITCNGETAVQDVLFSSTIGVNENDSESPLPDKQLFRNLACKKNVPTNRFLVTYSSSIFLDIDDLQVLERDISLSIQECFQLKCISETGIEGSATQVVVDLTSNRDYCGVLLTGSRMELLSLCLLEDSKTGVIFLGFPLPCLRKSHA
ncbi:hypothetical protein OS493_031614 [Desmophyllum pertusum]|uniref:Uncharacterized protein n=1 Tax=Desmophyllum pertusum TaxID=174260 RepID=A0A9W9YJN1_9CNID|nr:hypothetical protein OS493_031614 [Desmophyllum pertusum]